MAIGEERGEEVVDGGKLLLPVGADFLGVEADHGVEVVGVLGAELEDALGGGEVDGGQEYLADAGLAGLLHHRFAVVVELLAI